MRWPSCCRDALALLLLLALAMGPAWATSSDNVCANVCTCKWKGGKRTVECKPGVLNNIPDGIDPETQVLDVSDNDIGALTSNIFIKVRLTNLQRLYLRGCRIGRIDHSALAGLTNLVELDLSQNRLSDVPSQSFAGVPFLRELSLAHNPIGYIGDKAFKTTPNLVKLDLSSAELADLAPKSFHGLEQLEVLKLSHNRLDTLKYPGTFEPLGKLTSLELHENPWICDCHLREVKSYLLRRNLPTPIAPVCQRPEHLVNKSFGELGLDDFACPPVIQIVSRHAEATIGENASIVCQVSAIPPAKIRWLWNGKLYTNHTAVNSYQRILIQEEGLLFQKQSTLVLTNAQETDSSMFFCVAENQAGSVEANFTLHVSLRTAGMSSLGSGQIAGISAALVVLILLILLTITILFARLRRMPAKEVKAPPGPPDSGTTGTSEHACHPNSSTNSLEPSLAQQQSQCQSATSTVSRRKPGDELEAMANFETMSSTLPGYGQRPNAASLGLGSESGLLHEGAGHGNYHHHHHHHMTNRGYEDTSLTTTATLTRLQAQHQQHQQSALACYSSTIDNPDLIRDTRRGSGEEAAMPLPGGLYGGSVLHHDMEHESKLLYSECLSWADCRPSVSVNPYLAKDSQQQQQQQLAHGIQQQQVLATGGGNGQQQQQESFPAGAKQIRVWQKGVPVLPPVSALKRVLSTRSSPDEGYQEGTGTDV